MPEVPDDSKQIEKNLDELDNSITALKREYDIFFSGGSKTLPLSSQRKIEKTIKRYSNLVGLSYAHRFRYNTIVARFNTYLELWNKQMRMKEEGRTPTGGLVVQQAENKQKGSTAEPDTGDNKLKNLFQEYVRTRQQTGEGAPKLNFQGFCQLITKQKEAIVQKYNCKDVDFYVKVEDGRAKLKARPVK